MNKKDIKVSHWYWANNHGIKFQVAWTGEIDKDCGNLICIDRRNREWSIPFDDLSEERK